MGHLEQRYRALLPADRDRVRAVGFGIFISLASIVALLFGIQAAAEVGKIAGSILGVEMGYVIADYTRRIAQRF